MRKKVIRKWINDTIIYERKKLNYIDINFCSDSFLLKMNKKHLKHNTLTDIITFDMCDNGLVTADIYISITRVKENAKANKTKFVQELHRVIIHGILHLCGYNDKKPEEIKIIRDKEDFYLSLIK
jgi:rRNA maturation RNase YbeY